MLYPVPMRWWERIDWADHGKSIVFVIVAVALMLAAGSLVELLWGGPILTGGSEDSYPNP